MSTDKQPTRNIRPESTRHLVDMPGASQRRGVVATSQPTLGTGRKLIVGRGISLTGEITACEHLLVEGTVEAKLKDCRAMDIADTGVFKGGAELEQADIAGRFDGDLTVRGRLLLPATGVVAGTLHYGEMQVEAGGQIIGTMEPLESVVTPIHDANVKAADATLKDGTV